MGARDYLIRIFDNSDQALDDKIRRDFEHCGNIRYTYIAKTVDVIENFNFALRAVESKYAILIGDDDFVLPEVFSAVEILEENDLECLIHPRPAYYWPGVKFDREFAFFRSSSLMINESMSSRLDFLDPAAELARVRAAGAVYLFNLPAVYHALIRSDVLHGIRQRFGEYVLGPSPDMSLAVALCAQDVRYARSSIPFSIAGASYNSAAGMGRRGDHTASLERAPSWLPKAMKQAWDPRLPDVWNGYSVYAQSLLAVAKRAQLSMELNFPALFRKMIAEDLRDIRYVRPKLARLGWACGNWTLLLGFVEGVARRAIRYFPTIMLDRMIRTRPHFRTLTLYQGIDSPLACIECAEAHIARRRH